MVLGFGQAKAQAKGPARVEDVPALIARKNYAKAIEIIKSQLATQRQDPRLRLQLADVLAMAGKSREAVTILIPLADEYAREGFVPKAISVLKKIEKIDPGRRDIESKLATLIKKKQEEAVPAVSTARSFDIGMEEIGLEPPGASGPSTAPPSGTATAMDAGAEIGMEAFEIGIASAQPRSTAPAPARDPVPASEPPLRHARDPEPQPPAQSTRPAAQEPEPFTLAAPEGPEPLVFAPAPAPPPAAPAVAPTPAPAPEARPATQARPASARPASTAPVLPSRPAEPVIDRDLVDMGDLELVEAEPQPVEVEPASVEPELEAEPLPADADEAEPLPPDAEADEAGTMSEASFADELLSLVEDAFPGASSGEAAPIQAPLSTGGSDGRASGGSQIVVSPLFKDFSVDEMVAVIHGLNLLNFAPGDVVIRQGEPGHSLFMLTSGSVKAYVKDASGRQREVCEFNEGAFFGEVSILTGKPRSATIVAVSHCELLELDRPTLDSISSTHPHVWDVMQEFAQQRMSR
jgi:hypothetical protein